MHTNSELAKPRPRATHVFPWLCLTLLVLLFASKTALFGRGDLEQRWGFVKILKLRGEVLVSQVRYGRDHINTRNKRVNLTRELRDQRQYAAATKEWRSVNRSSSRARGPIDVITMQSTCDLAGWLEQIGNYREAAAEHRAIFDAFERVLGLNDDATLLSLENLGEFLQTHQQPDEALTVTKLALERAKRTLANGSPMLKRYQDAYLSVQKSRLVDLSSVSDNTSDERSFPDCIRLDLHRAGGWRRESVQITGH
ncbi:MAG: hypothetical protein JWM16_1563 [Verrucomicrobiales bacterium]|nr:hypothetical protein [Verrucomicrobiales bacterium]